MGAVIHRVPVDEEGMDTSKLTVLLKTVLLKTKKFKLLYVIPHHHHPTTVTMSTSRRIQLLSLIKEYQIWAIEVIDMMGDESFKLVYISNDDNTKAVAFVGYRTMHTLRTSWMIYIDDLYTDPVYRGKGYAGALLDYVDREAADAGIESVHLDSEYMLHDAHRLYLNKKYVLACNHFAKRTILSV